MPFRSLAYQEMLEQDGVPRDHARAHARAMETFIADEQVRKEDLSNLGRELRVEIDITRTELKTEIGSTRKELKAEIESTRKELKAEIESTRKEFKAEIESTKQELSSKIELQGKHLEARIDQLDITTRQRLSELKFDMVRWIGGIIGTATITLLVALWRFTK